MPVDEVGLLPEPAQHLSQAALEAERDVHLAAEAGRAGGRGSLSGGNMRNGLPGQEGHAGGRHGDRARLTGPAGHFTRLLPKYTRRTGPLNEMVLSLTAEGLTSGEIIAHLSEVYGMTTTKESVSTTTDKALESMAESAPARRGLYGDRHRRDPHPYPQRARRQRPASTWPSPSQPTVAGESWGCGPAMAGWRQLVDRADRDRHQVALAHRRTLLQFPLLDADPLPGLQPEIAASMARIRDSFRCAASWRNGSG
ncbi:transposase [Streptomyces sp. NPDC058694]|uniref:transposase n=1 Tax=Streptomyces sp. NPDC058694 TaxID=3346603 RepID=UPI00366513BC